MHNSYQKDLIKKNENVTKILKRESDFPALIRMVITRGHLETNTPENFLPLEVRAIITVRLCVCFIPQLGIKLGRNSENERGERKRKITH